MATGVYGAETFAGTHLVYTTYSGRHCCPDMRATGCSTKRKFVLIVDIQDLDMPWTDACMGR